MTTPTVQPLISVVACVFNEEDIIEHFLNTLIALFNTLDFQFEIICVNDGSTDTTLKKIIPYTEQDKIHIKIIDLSRNFGKEAALTAGLNHAKGNAIIPMDSDLQDPPELIPEMIEKWLQGYDVVLAHRLGRHADSRIKKITAKLFYSFHNRLSEVKIPPDVGDFRLMDRRVVDAINLLPENRRFMKGLFAWVGFNSTQIDYTRPGRYAGNSKFSIWKLWNFAIEGLTGFSTVPLRIWTYLGLIVSSLSFMYIIFVIILNALHKMPFSGYATLVVSIMGLGGIQLIGIGILGEYIGRIYLESKRRPTYIIKKIVENKLGGD